MHQPSLLDKPTLVTPAPADELALAGLVARTMVAALDATLDRLAAIPMADWARWDAGAGDYVRLRRCALPQTPPSWWPWGYTLRDWERLTWALAVARGIRSMVGWGAVWPAVAVSALDDRAYALRVDLHCDWFSARDRETAEERYQRLARQRRAALAKWHISPDRPVTRGEASDALLAVSALASWRKALRGAS